MTDAGAKSLAEQAIDAANALHGSHPGSRAFHAKGTLCRGRFTASPDGARLTRAAHMQGEPVDVTARLSNGSGDPDEPDGKPDGRGLATKFYLPDGSRTDTVTVSLPLFFVRTPEDFVAFSSARAPNPKTGRPRAFRLLRYLLTHPEALRAVRAARPALRPVPSYANCRFNSLHAFRWIAADGTARHVRYSWVPQAGEARLSGDEAKQRGPDFLQEELRERLEREAVRYDLELTLAADGDPVDDPTAPWPDDRERVIAGTLELTGLETGRDTGDDVLVFDPTRVTDGIELSGDKVLRFRRDAYAVSVERRSGVRLEA